MKIKRLNKMPDGRKTIEIRANEISYRGLIRCLKSNKNIEVTNEEYNPLNDDAVARIRFGEELFSLTTPFSDYLISNDSSECPEAVFDALFLHLENYKVKWWDKIS